MTTKADQETIQFLRQRVEAFEASGLTWEACSKQTHINMYQLDYWQKRNPHGWSNRKPPCQISDEPTDVNSHVDPWIGQERFDPGLWRNSFGPLAA